jgi:translocator protein|tara:strand:+ start:52 stop:804 length:753 start_codon:yes stop_codon:yes gene_type:complete
VITDENDLKIAPAGYAFSIWGVIYSLLGVFMVYQALPGDWVPERNDKLIFEDLGYHFAANMVINGLWLILFMTGGGTTVGFGLALVDIIAMLTSNIWILYQASTTELNLVEALSLRGGFTIYSGWVTAATILNVSFLLKALGLADPNILYGFNEENLTETVLWVALVIYNLFAYSQRNPLYGSIFIWVTLAIKSELLDKHADLTSLIDTLTTISGIQIVSMVVLWTLLSSEIIYDLDAPSNWNTGLFYGW